MLYSLPQTVCGTKCANKLQHYFFFRNSQKEIEARLMEHVTEHLLASEQQLREEMQQKVAQY